MSQDRNAARPDPVPPTHPGVTPYLAVDDAAGAIDFYKRAFDAVEEFRLVEPTGKIGHAEIRINGWPVMLSDEYPDFGAIGPKSIGGSPAKFHFYVADVDAAVERAVAAGATLVRPVRDEFFGDRGGMVADPYGYNWFISSRIEEVTPKEIQRRWTESMKE